jgi:hypothetical protein
VKWRGGEQDETRQAGRKRERVSKHVHDGRARKNIHDKRQETRDKTGDVSRSGR